MEQNYPLTCQKILDLTKLKACADDKINVTQKVNFVNDMSRLDGSMVSVSD